MIRQRKPQPETQNEVQERDLFGTPRYAVELIIPYIKTPWVWEPAAGDLYISKVLQEAGIKVLSTDIRMEPPHKLDFLNPTAEWSIGGQEHKHTIITNPPYSLKKKFVDKCIKLDLPFALLIQADYCEWMITAIRKYGCEKLVPTKRIDYITPTGKSGETGNKSYFHSLWLTRYMTLGGQEVFVDLTNEDKKRIY